MTIATSAKAAQNQPARNPKPMARPEIHDTAARIFDHLPRGRLLDIPAGEGALAARLADAGFQVRACDLYPEIFLPPLIEIRAGDLSGTLPYGNAEFDCVACIEGLEHIENPHQAIREFSRVLAPGGHLVVSVPNILNIEERLKWLFFGYTSHFKPISQEHLEMRREQVGSRLPVALHINPVAYTELRYALQNSGFELLAMHRDHRKARLWMYWPLVAVIRCLGRCTSAEKRRERWTDELQSDAVLLGGNTLILHARKK